MSHSIALASNQPAPVDIRGLLHDLDSVHKRATALVGVIPSIGAAWRYRSVVAAKVLQAKPDEAVDLLRAHRQTHAVLLGVLLGSTERSGATPDGGDEAPTVTELYEALSEVVSESGKLILATTLLYLLHEIDVAVKLDSHEAGRSVWRRSSQQALDATCDRLGAFLCLAIAKEEQFENIEVCDALAWLAWTSGAGVWASIDEARRQASVIDPTFPMPDLEPVYLDYLDATSPDELVSWIQDDEDISVLTFVVSSP